MNEPSKDEAMKALSKLFLAFPNSGDEGERAARFTVYWEVLRDLPPSAVIAACNDASRTEGFLPAVGTLYQLATRELPVGPKLVGPSC
jgi:hypothetical protein